MEPSKQFAEAMACEWDPIHQRAGALAWDHTPDSGAVQRPELATAHDEQPQRNVLSSISPHKLLPRPTRQAGESAGAQLGGGSREQWMDIEALASRVHHQRGSGSDTDVEAGAAGQAVAAQGPGAAGGEGDRETGSLLPPCARVREAADSLLALAGGQVAPCWDDGLMERPRFEQDGEGQALVAASRGARPRRQVQLRCWSCGGSGGVEEIGGECGEGVWLRGCWEVRVQWRSTGGTKEPSSQGDVCVGRHGCCDIAMVCRPFPTLVLCMCGSIGSVLEIDSVCIPLFIIRHSTA
jgi:hypothetical protein